MNKTLQQKSKLPANQAGGSTVKDFFEANKNSMAAVLPKHVSAERMIRIALTALRNTPDLMQCTTESLMGAVMQCAQLGLEPNTLLGHSYLIPFKNKKEQRTDVQVIIGYRGLIDLARRSGQIESLSAHAVFENDSFKFAYGLHDSLIHEPSMDNRGDIVAFYAVAKLKDGGHVFEVMSRNTINGVMAKTQSRGAYGPWKDHFEEMGRKTVIRRLFKYLPVSIEIATATAMDEVAEVGGNQHMESVLEGDYSISSMDYDPVDDDIVDQSTGEILTQQQDAGVSQQQAEEVAQTEMTDDEFMNLHDIIKAKVESGAKTPAEMMNWLSGKGKILTKEHEKTIKSFETK
jgi:recombination protein RecT